MGRLNIFRKKTISNGCCSFAQIRITTLIAASMPPDARSQKAPRKEGEAPIHAARIPPDGYTRSFAGSEKTNRLISALLSRRPGGQGSASVTRQSSVLGAQLELLTPPPAARRP